MADTSISQDPTKPSGEVCNTDGTLKDASAIDWYNSPSDNAPFPFSKQAHDEDIGENTEGRHKKPQVSIW